MSRLDSTSATALRCFDAGEDRDLDDPLLQKPLVEAVGGSDFTLHFGDLGEMGLVEEIGRYSERNGENMVISQPRYRLTDRGRSLVSRHGPEFDPETLQGEVNVEPEVRTDPEPVGREPDQLADLSDSVDAFIENTEKVILYEGVEWRQGDPKGTVVVTLTYDGETATIKIPAINWHNSGLNYLFDEVHQAFGFPPNLDEREWGILQQRWIDMAEIVNYDDHDDLDNKSNADDLKL